jgi:crotonobetainyl-CoA:carnitine CoA-transferase CaiB-like acyl-CoA transferase
MADRPGALSHVRICDFTGQLAGAGATKFLAAMGAQVIRIEEPAKGAGTSCAACRPTSTSAGA